MKEAAFDSWKEIARFLVRSVRTVQRWERTERLPVRRHEHTKGGTVYAYPSELAKWLRARESEGIRRTRGELEQQCANLRALTKRQRALASELHELISRNEETWKRINGLPRGGGEQL
ncbi:MAG TPA: hypothetical protein VND65_07750 [Candidatus Binatia bacterium]|nr:hypothetical protein [Candidatus Binatia bacterium]